MIAGIFIKVHQKFKIRRLIQIQRRMFRAMKLVDRSANLLLTISKNTIFLWETTQDVSRKEWEGLNQDIQGLRL